jgi:uncharacterized protein
VTDLPLSPIEVRVLGSLMEKALTTPEYYPLTLNALVLACNQKSNREPVMELDEVHVSSALAELIRRQMAYEVAGSRAQKYGQNFTRLQKLIGGETAALCVMLLRGPQTPGEIKGRTGRMKEWSGLEEVEAALNQLIERGYAAKLPRAAGRKENRYAHLLAGAPAIEEEHGPAPVLVAAREGNDRMTTLEEEVRALRAELEELKNTFVDFKRQFE